MAYTTVNGVRSVPGASTHQSVTLTLDNSYPTGGYPINAQTFGFLVLRGIAGAFFTTIAGAAYEIALVPTLNADGTTFSSFNLALVVGSTGAQVAAATDLHTVSLILVGEGN